MIRSVLGTASTDTSHALTTSTTSDHASGYDISTAMQMFLGMGDMILSLAAAAEGQMPEHLDFHILVSVHVTKVGRSLPAMQRHVMPTAQ